MRIRVEPEQTIETMFIEDLDGDELRIDLENDEVFIGGVRTERGTGDGEVGIPGDDIAACFRRADLPQIIAALQRLL